MLQGDLIFTYSQVDKSLFPTRESFAKKCAEAFGGDERVSFYVCAEAHGAGGTHYHVSIKLTQAQRWGTAKNKLSEAGAVVNFSKPANGEDGMYAWAYRYVTKYDQNIYHSLSHPSLENITSNTHNIHEANAAYRQKRRLT